MWHDNDTTIDLIDFGHLVNGVKRIIENDRLLPCSIGVFGDWGSGKSSLLRMIEQQFQGRKDLLIVKFNGWLFEGYEDAKTVLMGSILEEIQHNRKLSARAKKLVSKLLKRLNLLKAAGLLMKYGITGTTLGPAGLGMTAAQDLLRGVSKLDIEGVVKEKKSESVRISIREFHNDFQKLLKETTLSRMVVFIDDLDRCTPDTVISTLEAIKLFLFVPSSAFVISADEKLIKYAVRRRFPEIPGEIEQVGRDYLEKLIQFPVRIPPLNPAEIETYMNLLFAQLHMPEKDTFEELRRRVLHVKRTAVWSAAFSYSNAHELVTPLTEQLKESLSLSAQITPILASGLNGNPRQCKRFLNMLLIRIEMASSKGISLKLSVLAKLMLLEYFKPEAFKRLFDLQVQNQGPSGEVHILEKKARVTATSSNPETRNGTPVQGDEQENVVLESDLEAWLRDDWMRMWLHCDPELGDLDLREYFYFSRDRINIEPTLILRMSAQAQEIVAKLLGESDTLREQALQQSTAISTSDASAVFEVIASRARSQDDLGRPNSALSVMFGFCGRRTELITQLISFLHRLPESAVPPSVIPKLQQLTKGSAFAEIAESLFLKWSKSLANPTLASILTKRIHKN